MDLNEVLVFARVVRAGSFTAAARELRMPKSTVSRKVTELEERLSARLLQRTTRKLNLTDAGRIYYEYAARIASEVEDAERAVADLQETPRGLLRVTTPIGAAWLGPIVSDFLARYRKVELDVFCTGRTVDLVEEGFDLGIRAGTLADSTLIARSLGTSKWFAAATPQYLKKRGRPRAPDDLKKHDCLLFGVAPSGLNAHFARASEQAHVALSPRMLVSDFDVLYSAVIKGLGIAILPAFRCVEALRAGLLEPVLRDWIVPETPVSIVYPSTRHLSPKVKTFIDFLLERMTPPPWELGPKP